MHLSSILRSPRFLLCRPSFFDVRYSINPWMRPREGGVDRERAMGQWEGLREAIESAGGSVSVMEPVGGESLPDLVFTANAAVVRGKKAFLASFHHEERKKEKALNRRWFEDNGYTVEEDPSGEPFEGAGDALFGGPSFRHLFCGIGPRSSTSSLPLVSSFLSTDDDPITTVACRLVSHNFYHIDVAFCPLSPSLALWYPDAFDDVARHNLSSSMRLLPVSPQEASNFACNAVVVNETVILQRGNVSTVSMLRKEGWRVAEVPMDEFIKAGGSAKCCTLRIE